MPIWECAWYESSMEELGTGGVRDTPHDDIEVRLLQTTIDLAVEGGYDAVRQRDVAARAGVAMATVYSRFAGKDDLLAAALTFDGHDMLRELLAMPNSGGTPHSRVTKLFAKMTEIMMRRPNLTRAALRAATSGKKAPMLRLMEGQQRLMRVVVSTLCGPKRAPELDQEAARQVAMVLMMAWFGNLTAWAGEVSDPLWIDAIMDNTAKMLLHGV